MCACVCVCVQCWLCLYINRCRLYVLAIVGVCPRRKQTVSSIHDIDYYYFSCSAFYILTKLKLSTIFPFPLPLFLLLPIFYPTTQYPSSTPSLPQFLGFFLFAFSPLQTETTKQMPWTLINLSIMTRSGSHIGLPV